MRGPRRFSQAISEGDGISLLVEVADVDAARTAASSGAEALVAHDDVAGLRDATELPILWYPHGGHAEAARAGADASVVVVDGLEDENGRLESLYREALDHGLDCVVAVRDEDELQLALDRVDPEILLLRSGGAGDGLEHVLGLLPDVPAGKLAIAEVDVSERAEVEELERAGVDGVIVRSPDVRGLVGEPAPEP